MVYLSTVAVFLCLTLLSVTAQEDCPLPTNTVIISALGVLLNNADGTQTYNPSIKGDIHYVCQSQGTIKDRYRYVSIIATYTPNTGQPQATSIFQLACVSASTWEPDTSGGIPNPASGLINANTRTDCFDCTHSFGSADRCRTCDSACNSGLRRCFGSGSARCCTVFLSGGQCSTDCSLDGVNYVATMSNNYTCECNLTCSPGYTENSDCTNCTFTNICLRDEPCQNNGVCTLISAPDQYECNCTGTGYQGVNCDELIPSPSPSPSPSPTSSSVSPSPSCTLSGCGTCDAVTTSCCATCVSGYSMATDGCSCATSTLTVVPSCPVEGCSVCSQPPPVATPNCCATCLDGYDKEGACNCLAITSSADLMSSMIPTESASPSQASGIPAGTLIGAILGIIIGVLLLLTLVAVIAYIIYYFVAGAGSGTNKAKSKSPFANGESHNNPLYLAPDEVEGSNL